MFLWNIFLRKTYLISHFSFTVNYFFNKHGVLLGQPQYAHDFSRLSLMLCLQNMLTFSPWGHSKSIYALKEGEWVLQKRAKKYKGRRSSKSVSTAILFLKQCFHIFTAYFCFLLRKVKTLKSWKLDQQKKAKKDLSTMNNIYIRQKGVPHKRTKAQKGVRGEGIGGCANMTHFQKQLVLFASMKTLSKWWMFLISSEKLFSFFRYLQFSHGCLKM